MNYSEYAKKIQYLRTLKNATATKESNHLIKKMNSYISQEFVRRLHLTALDCDIIYEACQWNVRCPSCGESKLLYGHGRLPLLDNSISCESYICRKCGSVFSMKTYGWAYIDESNTIELTFPVQYSNSRSEMWYKFLSEYLKEWHRVSLVHKRGSVKNISTVTGLSRKTVRQWTDIFFKSIHWVCSIANNNFTFDDFLSRLIPEDIETLLWILYLYSYGIYDRLLLSGIS